MKIIVNVDDLGLHPAVQRAVKECVRVGTVNSATLMANGPYVKDALELRDQLGLGAHLNILRGTPISKVNEIRSLVTPNGLFKGNYSELLKAYYLGAVDLQHVETEWNAQICRLKDLGFELDHLDSEKHIHCWPNLMEIACKLAKRYGIKWVRRTRENPFSVRCDAGSLRSRLLWFWSCFHKKPSDVFWPDAVWGVADQGEKLTSDRFLHWAKRQKSNVDIVEICCHPGFPLDTDNPVDASFGSLRVPYQWKNEYLSLLDESWVNVFRELGQLTRYGDIKKPSV